MSTIVRCDHCKKELSWDTQAYSVYVDVSRQQGVATQSHALEHRADACSEACALAWLLETVSTRAKIPFKVDLA